MNAHTSPGADAPPPMWGGSRPFGPVTSALLTCPVGGSVFIAGKVAAQIGPYVAVARKHVGQAAYFESFTTAEHGVSGVRVWRIR
jgi:hypothetical protein